MHFLITSGLLDVSLSYTLYCYFSIAILKFRNQKVSKVNVFSIKCALNHFSF